MIGQKTQGLFPHSEANHHSGPALTNRQARPDRYFGFCFVLSDDPLRHTASLAWAPAVDVDRRSALGRPPP
ncbi:hypothetical protein VTN49DRAFT_2232 [Thermomyces lanuginosus]|uniref:uncharacterized protein n=1 Tax=Thermomyces lanuginosus TaxID=5541 RepID=UPI003742DFD8